MGHVKYAKFSGELKGILWEIQNRRENASGDDTLRTKFVLRPFHESAKTY